LEKKWADAQKLLESLTSDILEKIPFCRLLGLKIEELTLHHAVLSLDKQPALIGNFITDILHGGVISAVIDSAGGSLAMASVFRNHADEPFENFKNKLSKVSTIDMRVDFLQPGRGEHFTARAKLLRSGKRICVTSVELHNDINKLIAAGTATYLIG